MTMAFDKLDYHVQSALSAGQPEEHAFTHIGLFLAWLIRHDLHNPVLIRDEWAAAVKAGEMTGSDLADAIDGKLVSDVMTPGGAAFTAGYYDIYLDDYAKAFASEAEYAVPDHLDSYERIAPVIDGRHADWIAAGRPQPDRREPDLGQASVSGFGPGEVALGDLRATALDDFRGMAAEQGWVVESVAEWSQMPHDASGLEELIPRDLSQPPISTSSVDASHWGDPLLKRALKRLGLNAKDCLVAAGIGGEGAGVITATLYALPTIGADDLEREFASMFHLPPRGRWEAREVDGKPVQWAGGRDFQVAFWALEGLVVHASASDAKGLEQLISRLP